MTIRPRIMLRNVLLATVASTSFTAMPVLAQEAASAPKAAEVDVDEVVVTG